MLKPSIIQLARNLLLMLPDYDDAVSQGLVDLGTPQLKIDIGKRALLLDTRRQTGASVPGGLKQR